MIDPGDHHELCIMHLNVCGLSGKLDELKEMIVNFPNDGIMLDIIIMCETFLTDLNEPLLNRWV